LTTGGEINDWYRAGYLPKAELSRTG
jgi:hypothetical protein